MNDDKEGKEGRVSSLKIIIGYFCSPSNSNLEAVLLVTRLKLKLRKGCPEGGDHTKTTRSSCEG